MKFKIFLSLCFCAFANLAFSQTQETKKDLNQAIEEMSEMLKSLDLNKLLNEDLFSEIEKIKPSEKELEQLQSAMSQSLKAMEKIDFSAFEEMAKELETIFKDIDLPQSPKPANSDSKKSKGKRI